METANSSFESLNGTDFPLDLNTTETWVLPDVVTVCLSLFGVLGCIMNIFVFVMYWSKESLRTSANTFVLSLASSDILRSVIFCPFCIIFFKRWINGVVWCRCFNFFSLFINLTTAISIVAIACDRRCAVKDPLHYVKNNSKKRAAMYGYCVWISSILLAIPIPFGFPEIDYDTCDIKVSSAESIFDLAVMYEATIAFAAFIVPLSSVVYLYYGMHRAARNNTSRDERYSSSSYASSDVVVNLKSPRSSGDSDYCLRRHFYIREGENSQQRNHFLKKHRAAVTGLLAVMSLIICLSPYFIVRFYQKFSVVTIQLQLWVHLNTLMSSIVDPYIYFYRNRSTWNYTKKLVSKIFHRKKSSMYLSNNIRSRVADVRHLYNISTRISQTVAENQLKVNRNFCRFSKNEQDAEVQVTLHNQDSLQQINDTKSTVTRQLVHEDSASSNYNSDFSPTIVSSDFSKVMPIQVLTEKFSDDTSSE